MSEHSDVNAAGPRAESPESPSVYLGKARASLAGADVELANDLCDNAVNRAYYACYQAAVAALVAEGVQPLMDRYWPHDLVQTQFPSVLIDRRGCYPRRLRTTLKAIFDERLKADYEPDRIDRQTASEAVRRAHDFVEHICQRIDIR